MFSVSYSKCLFLRLRISNISNDDDDDDDGNTNVMTIEAGT